MARKIKDISPKLNLKTAEQELAMPNTELPIGQLLGGLAMFNNSFKRGSGNNIFGCDERGLWLGAADFDDAPLRMYMNGNIYLQTDDGAIIIDTANKRIIVNDGSHDRVLIGYLLNGF